MEKRTNPEPGIETKAIRVLKALLCSYIVTAVLLLVLTLLLYKLNLDEAKVNVGIILIYIVSTFVGGFVIGKINRSRKFIWGLVVGILYFALLLLISLGLYRSLQENGKDVLTTFLLCAGGGMLGGMIS